MMLLCIPQTLQEHEYLRNCVGRIATLQPDIVLVEKTVSRLAQGFLLDAGISLVINVKPVGYFSGTLSVST
jgi:1-phosphatidylinositol-3-phosphate 5-kinase